MVTTENMVIQTVLSFYIKMYQESLSYSLQLDSLRAATFTNCCWQLTVGWTPWPIKSPLPKDTLGIFTCSSKCKPACQSQLQALL